MEEEKKKKKGGIGWIIIYIVLVIAFIGVGFAVNFVMPKAITEERTIDVDTLKSEVSEINELATLQYDYREVLNELKNTSTKIFTAKINTGKSGFISTFDGCIKAGVDLNKVNYDIKNPEEGSDDSPVITVSLPEAVILSHEDSNPETLYEEGINRSSIGNSRNKAIDKKKDEKEKEFISAGNLDKAKVQAQDAITDFIHSVYGDDVVVEFEDK